MAGKACNTIALKWKSTWLKKAGAGISILACASVRGIWTPEFTVKGRAHMMTAEKSILGDVP